MRTSLPARNVGVTGFISVDQIRAVQEIFNQLFGEYAVAHRREGAKPRLMAGIPVSSRTIVGLPNRQPGCYAKAERLKELFHQASSSPHTLAVAHYNTDRPDNGLAEAEWVMETAGPGLGGFQFNICWPEPSILRELRGNHPKLHLLLQVGSEALSQFDRGEREGYDVAGFLAKVNQYAGCLNGILLDPSGGTGKPLQANRLAPLVRGLMQIEGLEISVAGGLSATTLHLFGALPSICPYLGGDAQTGVLNPGTGSLCLDRVKAYLQGMRDLFCPVGRHHYRRFSA